MYILRKIFPNSNGKDRNIFRRRIQFPIQVITSWFITNLRGLPQPLVAVAFPAVWIRQDICP